MDYAGKPLVPPECPARLGQYFDVTEAMLDITVQPHVERSYCESVAGRFALYGSEIDSPAVRIGPLSVRKDGDLAETFRHATEGSEMGEKLKQELLQRVDACQCSDRIGTCWALDAHGLYEAAQKLSE